MTALVLHPGVLGMASFGVDELAGLDVEQLDAMRGWVETQRRGPGQDDEARRRLLERIDEAIRTYV